MKAKKSLSQNFLQDQSVIKRMIEAAEIQKGETILEIGPGTGVLTQALVEAGARVIAVERDPDLIPALRERFGESATIAEGDILRLTQDPVLGLKHGKYKLVANLPYHITSPILERFLSHATESTRMVVMVQKEVADRIVGKPPRMSVLSVACQLYAEVKRLFVVPAGSWEGSDRLSRSRHRDRKGRVPQPPQAIARQPCR